MHSLLQRGTQVRWTVVGLVVIGALVAAIWPRSPDAVVLSTGPTAAGPVGSVTVDDAALTAARSAAALAPCPSPASPSSSGGPLTGVLVDCLGAPGRLDLGASLQGRTTLVNVWASWCGPCRTEIPVLQAYSASPDALPLVGLDVRDDPASALALLAELGAGYPSLVDVGGAAEAALAGPPVLPLSYLVAPDGTVRRLGAPAVLASVDDVRAAIANARQ